MGILSLLTDYALILIDLLQYVCVLLIIFYLLFQTGVLKKIEISGRQKTNIKEIALILLLFGFLAILASKSAFKVGDATACGPGMEAKANVRDLPPLIAGLLGGPVAGIGAGLISGLYRLYEGGVTAVPCSIATFLAGVSGGILFYITKKKFLRPLHAAIYAGSYEIFHLGLVLLITRPFDCAFGLVKILFIPMVAANSFGLFLFAFMIRRAMNYQVIKEKKDKIEAELHTAHEIQINMLPRIFPPFPDRKEFDLYAYMKPAKEVGGDFYDFFFVDRNKICVVIGDVSDKGVPAALFMTIVKTLLKTEALRNKPLNEVLQRVNDILHPDNESGSFVTVFCAVLDTEAGEITFANGGHLAPVICCDGSAEFVKIDTNYILGCLPEATFTQQKLGMKPGETLFLYTDGATEANNVQREMFTSSRLIGALKKSHARDKDMKSLVHDVVDEIAAFSGDAEQYDDITILALHYRETDPDARHGIKEERS